VGQILPLPKPPPLKPGTRLTGSLAHGKDESRKTSHLARTASRASVATIGVFDSEGAGSAGNIFKHGLDLIHSARQGLIFVSGDPEGLF
jgi:hypothetical protein